MQIAFTRPLWLTTVLIALVPACSENTDLEPGTFTASLSGARVETLSGSAVAGTVYTEAGVQYTINLRMDLGEQQVFLVVDCPGEETPGTGEHPIGTAENDCRGTYRRTLGDPFTATERAEAVSGTLEIRRSEDGAIAGSFEFSGPLVVGETAGADLIASATFNAASIFGQAGPPLDAAAHR